MHGRTAPRYALADAAHSPLLVFYEVTRACALACRHCRARAMPRAHPHELSTAASLSLLEDLAGFPKPPMLVLTGGDPFARADLFTLIEHAVSLGLHTSLAPSATPRVTEDLLREAQVRGVQRLSISIDAAEAPWHDRFRGETGTFDDGLRILRDCRAMGLSTQVNTTVMPGNLDQLPAIADLVEDVGAAMWSVFFLVPTGRAYREDRLSPQQTEQVFDLLWRLAQTRPFAIKTTEAPFYRRFVKQRQGDPMRPQPENGGGPRMPARSPLGINDGKGICFVSHRGEVQPSGFLPLVTGRFPERSVVDVYQNHPAFVALRDPEQLKGKCGRCGFKSICGGSRARAYALTRDFLAEEPDCPYDPDLEPTLAPGRPDESDSASSASIPLEIRHV